MEIEGIPLEITVYNPKKKSVHRSPCEMPLDSLEMTEDVFNKAYGPHIVKAVFDLIQHRAFRQGLEKPKIKLVTE